MAPAGCFSRGILPRASLSDWRSFRQNPLQPEWW